MPCFHAIHPLVSDIDPTIREAQRLANTMLAQMPHPDPRTPEGLRALRSLTANNVAGTVLRPTDRMATTGFGDTRLRMFVPDGQIRGVMLRIHGGGWAAGAPEDDDTLNDQIARACSLVIVSPDYRLVPDVTVGDQVGECVALAEWLGANAAAEFGSDVLLLSGISAGAHLAAATLLHLRAAGSPIFARVVAAHLDSGPFDLGGTPSAHLASEQSLVLTHDWLFGLIEIGLPGYTSDQRRVPALSPMLNDLSGLPPALFTVGNLDPLRDDSILMAHRWQLAGSPADLDVWPEGAHAFTNLATPLGEVALQRTTSWITAVLDRLPSPAADGSRRLDALAAR